MNDNPSMMHTQFPSQICSVARALEIVGERWTLLIVREAFFGARRFSHFESNLGIAKNVLTDRLAKLVEAGVLDHAALVGRGNPGEYTLTEKGRDLFPSVVALMQWGDRWVYKGRNAPVKLLDRERREEIAKVRVTSSDGKGVALADVIIVPGPGADSMVQRRFGREKA